MSVTQRLMKPGSWELDLKANTPDWVLKRISEFDHIVITPTHLDPIAGFPDASILSSALYTGVVTRRDSRTRFGGFDLSWWLGSDKGTGDLLDTAVTQAAATLSTWVTALVPSSLTVGTVTNTGLGTHTAGYQWVSRREALDAVCRALGA